MGILQTIGGAVQDVQTFVTKIVRPSYTETGVMTYGERMDIPGYTDDPRLGWGSYSGDRALTGAEKRRLEILRERAAIKAAQQKQAQEALAKRLAAERAAQESAAKHQKFLTEQARRQQATKKFYEKRYSQQKKAGLLPTKKFYEKRYKKQRESGALPTAEFYEKRRQAQLILKEKPKQPQVTQLSDIMSGYKPPTFFQKIQLRDLEIEAQRTYERETSFKELYKKGDLPAIVRKGFRGAGTAFISFEEKVLGKKLPPEAKIKAGEFVGETALFVGVLSPIKTTAQLEKVLAKPTGVLFKGVQQEMKKGIVKTDIKFLTSKGEKGIATGLTKQTGKEGKVIISKTIGAGQIYKQGIKFPTGKVILKPTKTFIGIEKAFTRQSIKTTTRKVGDLTITRKIPTTTQISAGTIARFKGAKIPLKQFPKESIDRFLSGSLGFFKGKKTFIIGRTITEKTAGTFSFGVLKKIPTKTLTYKLTGAKGISKQVSRSTLKSLTSIIQAGVQQPKPFTLLPPGVKGAAPLISPLIKPLTVKLPLSLTASVIETPTQLPAPKFELPKQQELIQTKVKHQTLPKITQIEKQLPRQIVRQKLILGEKEKQESISAVLSLETQKQQQRLLQRMRLSLKQKQKTQLIRVPFIPISPVPKVPKIPISPFLRGGKQQKIPTGSFTVFLRRFGKFRPIGKFPTIKQASEVGRQAAMRTLGATFKVEGIGAKKLVAPKGFYQKPTKQGLLFIELPKFRLSMPTEIKEIQMFKRRKKFSLY